jgi:hypothetical protein
MRDTLENIKNAGTKIFVPAQAQGKKRTKRSPQKMMSPNLTLSPCDTPWPKIAGVAESAW